VQNAKKIKKIAKLDGLLRKIKNKLNIRQKNVL